jgi:hypothetical protein
MDETNDEGHDDGGSAFVMYSLSRHEVVRRATIAHGAVGFEASEEFVVIVRVLIYLICMHSNIVVVAVFG